MYSDKSRLSILLLVSFLVIACSDPIPEDQNSSPNIEILNYSPTTVYTDDTINLNCIATDEDGDALSYLWSSGSGSFPAGSNGSSVQWIAPDEGSVYTISISVSDGKDVTTDDMVIEVLDQESGTNQAPTIPASPYPSNNSSNVGLDTYLNWTSNDPEQDSIKYDLYFGESSDPPLVKSEVINQYSYPDNHEILDLGSTYYWKIVAVDENGNSTEGPVWSFTTKHTGWHLYQEISTGHHNQVRTLEFNSDGTRIAAGLWRESIKEWSVSNGSLLRTISENGSGKKQLAYSNDGSLLACALTSGRIEIWDTSTNTVLTEIDVNSGGVNSVDFSPDGSMLGCGTETWQEPGGVYLFETTNWTLSNTYNTTEAISSVSFNHDGTKIAAGGQDHTVKIIDVGTNQVVQTLLGHSYSLYDVTYNQDGSIIASTDGQEIRLWSSSNGTTISTVDKSSTDIAFANSGSSLLIEGGEYAWGEWIFYTELYDISSGNSLFRVRNGGADAIAFNPVYDMFAEVVLDYIADGYAYLKIRIWSNE